MFYMYAVWTGNPAAGSDRETNVTSLYKVWFTFDMTATRGGRRLLVKTCEKGRLERGFVRRS